MDNKFLCSHIKKEERIRLSAPSGGVEGSVLYLRELLLEMIARDISEKRYDSTSQPGDDIMTQCGGLGEAMHLDKFPSNLLGHRTKVYQAAEAEELRSYVPLDDPDLVKHEELIGEIFYDKDCDEYYKILEIQWRKNLGKECWQALCVEVDSDGVICEECLQGDVIKPKMKVHYTIECNKAGDSVKEMIAEYKQQLGE